jgi:hypothetical protein
MTDLRDPLKKDTSPTKSTPKQPSRVEDEPDHLETALATERALNIGAKTRKVYN